MEHIVTQWKIWWKDKPGYFVYIFAKDIKKIFDSGILKFNGDFKPIASWNKKTTITKKQ